jgi:hypothetical protein
MATKTYYFTGTAEWAKVYEPVEAYDKTKPKEFCIDVLLDDKSFELFKQSGSQLRPKENRVKFKCPSTALIKGEVVHFAPSVKDKDNEDFNDPIGNGSKVTVKVEVYDTRMGKGTRLAGVRVEELVEYEGGKYEGDVDAPF